MFLPDFVFSTLLDLGILALFGSPNAEVDLDLVRELPFTQNLELLWCYDRACAHYFGPFYVNFYTVIL